MNRVLRFKPKTSDAGEIYVVLTRPSVFPGLDPRYEAVCAIMWEDGRVDWLPESCVGDEYDTEL